MSNEIVLKEAFETEPLDANPSDKKTYGSRKEVFRAVGKFIRYKKARKPAHDPSSQTSSDEGHAPNSESNAARQTQIQPQKDDKVSSFESTNASSKVKETQPTQQTGPLLVNITELLSDDKNSDTDKKEDRVSYPQTVPEHKTDEPKETEVSQSPADELPKKIELEIVFKNVSDKEANTNDLASKVESPQNKQASNSNPNDSDSTKIDTKPQKSQHKKPFVVAKPSENIFALKNDSKSAVKKEPREGPLLAARGLPRKMTADITTTDENQEELTVTMILRSSSNIEKSTNAGVTPKTSSTSLPAILSANSPQHENAEPANIKSVENRAGFKGRDEETPRVIGQPVGEVRDDSRYYYVKSSSVAILLNDLKFLTRKKLGDLRFEILSNTFEGSQSKKFIPSSFETNSLFFLARSPYFQGLYQFLSNDQNKIDMLEGTRAFKKIIVRSPYNDDDSASAILNSYDPEIFGDGDLKLVPMELEDHQYSFRILPKISKRSFTEFLGYLQFGVCGLDSEYLIDILKLSTLFETSELSSLIEQHVLPTKDQLLDKMALGSVLELYYLANKNNLERLQNSCERFINENDCMFVNTKEWQEFLNRKPELVLKLFNNRHQN